MRTRERPKRLPPSANTLRELYLKSGNRCAFPGCSSVLFGAAGSFLGHVCYIEAAEPGGERFNPSQSNEQRREPSNLILLCYKHRVETSDAVTFSVERMRRMKEAHERRFSDVVEKMLSSLAERVESSSAIMPVSLERMSAVLGWSLSAGDLASMIRDVSLLIDRLSKVPTPARELFRVVVSRADVEWIDGIFALLPEVQKAADLDERELRDHLSILDRCGLACLRGTDPSGSRWVCVPNMPSGWSAWGAIKDFSDKAGVGLSRIIVDLDFSVLD